MPPRLSDVAGLPSIDRAKLPVTYASARTALAKCDRVDECRNWKDRMGALASYARQSQDGELVKMCLRIQARAFKRCGELLAQIKPRKGNPKPNGAKGGGAATLCLTRSAAARDAGLSKDQQMRAMRVARIPEDEFEALVESEDPPTLTELADRTARAKIGHAKIEELVSGTTPQEFQSATRAMSAVDMVVRAASSIDIPTAVRGIKPHEREQLKADLQTAMQWMTDLRQEIER